MTPLAQRYFKALTRPLSKRPPDPEGRLRAYEDLHCFDVSALVETVSACLTGHPPGDILRDLPGPFFLPAPATWIEMDFCGHLYAILLTMQEGRIEVSACVDDPRRKPHRVCPLRLVGTFIPATEPGEPWAIIPGGMDLLYMATFALTIVDVINTPGIVRLSARDPHVGFARDFAAAGHYPLRAWHEVVIDPTAIRDVGESHGGGRVPLHFVRAHRRRCASKGLIAIRAHWRGDPSIGMLRTRYRVEPPSPPKEER